MNLRPYQNQAIRDTYAALHEHNRVMLQLPTAAGKTHIAMAIIKHGLRHGKRIAFCVDRLTLLDQTLDAFIANGIPVGVVQGGHPMYSPERPVQVVSLQTLQRRDRKYWPPVDLFIFDEAHTHYDVMSRVMDTWSLLKYIGLSATPFTTGLGRHWDKLVVGATTEQLMNDGYLSSYVAYGPSAPDLTGVRSSQGDYVSSELDERMTVITGDIIKHYKEHAHDKKTIVFTPTVRYAEFISEEFRQAGFTADYVCGRDSDERRQEALTNFANGKTQILASCEVLIKGYDQPDIECGIVARPTRSLSLHIQMLGRLLRIAPGKDRALILDHAGNIERLGFPDDPLPTTLCTKERGTSTRDRREKDEPEPWNCSQCHFLVPPDKHICPQCGHQPKRPTNVEVVEGKLQKLVGKRSMVEKQAVYSQLLHIARERGYADGWVAHKYRTMFGVWPRKMLYIPDEPTPELLSWITSQNIRYANRREA
jgi:superfamily II DNA or RNA helicase